MGWKSQSRGPEWGGRPSPGGLRGVGVHLPWVLADQGGTTQRTPEESILQDPGPVQSRTLQPPTSGTYRAYPRDTNLKPSRSEGPVAYRPRCTSSVPDLSGFGSGLGLRCPDLSGVVPTPKVPSEVRAETSRPTRSGLPRGTCRTPVGAPTPEVGPTQVPLRRRVALLVVLSQGTVGEVVHYPRRAAPPRHYVDSPLPGSARSQPHPRTVR